MEESEFDHLRGLLVGPVVDEVAALRARVEELERRVIATDERASTVGEVLVSAVNTRRVDHPDGDAELSEALRPEVELAVHSSARTDSTVMAEALYPVLGPAIRKMIAALFSNDDSGTFSVDRVILFDRRTGLPMQQHLASGVEGEDADVISGMLDAIRSFVEDAFDAPETDGLNDLRVGDVSVIVEWGPLAGLAVVTRGVVPGSFRDVARARLERIHELHREALQSFSGDDATLRALAPDLAVLEEADTASKTSNARTIALAVAAVLAAVVIFVVAVILIVKIFGL